MKILILIIQIIIILAFALFGFQKIFMPLPDLIELGMLWIEDFPAWQVRTIGILEALGVLGLIFPYVFKSLPKVIVAVASGALALTMIGAIITHISRGYVILSIIINSILFFKATIFVSCSSLTKLSLFKMLIRLCPVVSCFSITLCIVSSSRIFSFVRNDIIDS